MSIGERTELDILRKAEKRLQSASFQVKIVISGKLSPDVKKERIDKLYRAMIRDAQRANKMAERGRESQ
jgi:hypothetical protein